MRFHYMCKDRTSVREVAKPLFWPETRTKHTLWGTRIMLCPWHVIEVWGCPCFSLTPPFVIVCGGTWALVWSEILWHLEQHDQSPLETFGQPQHSPGCASNGASRASQPWVRAGWVWSWTTPIWGVLGALLISPAWQSSALISVALGLVQFPMFQHLTGCNLIFPLHTHDGSEPAQVKFVFDSTAGLLPRFTTKSQFFLSSDIYGTAIVGEMLI